MREAQGVSAPLIAYYRGGDGYALDRAVEARRAAHRGGHRRGTGPLARERRGDGPAQIGERVATAPLFGGGCVAVVTDPGPLVRSKDAREAMERSLATVAPGNALVFLEPGDAGNKRAAMLVALEAAVVKAGGETKPFPAPKAGELAGWLRNLAKDRGSRSSATPPRSSRAASAGS